MSGPGNRSHLKVIPGGKTPNVTTPASAAKPRVTPTAGGGPGGGGPTPPTAAAIAKAKAIANERWKYVSTFTNTVAAAAIAVGFFTPTSAILSKGPDGFTDFDALVYGGMVIISLCVAAALHALVHLFLENLDP